MKLVIEVIEMSAHYLTSKVDIESRSHDLVADFRILRMSSLDTGSEEDRVLYYYTTTTLLRHSYYFYITIQLLYYTKLFNLC